MHLLSSIAPIFLLATLASAKPVPRSDQVVRCTLTSDAQIAHIKASHLDVWSHSLGLNHPADIRVSATERAQLEATGAKCDVFIDDLAPLLEAEQQPHLAIRQGPSALAADPYFSSYKPYSQIVDKVKAWAQAYPDRVKYLGSIGASTEGREIPAFKITNNKIPSSSKKSIYFNGGIHAREWISSATVMYVANALITSTDPQLSDFLDKVEFYITPISNPDGYEYSRTQDRYWRKNRGSNSNSNCVGVDLNRNWDEHFGVVGVDSNPCSETYNGPSAFSEPETKALSKFILSLPNRIAGIDWHSYGQYILRPWGWTTTKSKNEALYKALGDGVRDAIATFNGNRYSSITGAELYPASGATDDWMTAKAKMTGFTIELRDTGRIADNVNTLHGISLTIQ
ncbi:uncharacterized protein SPPG_06768 [Spizellomyces punctatus DAOM BR117]|uniref:Peptidase M14 domain-containing protein n=1 Tax=Spizellomyces punctatus (strain DAOM BR117) TaxID=645134 RepID=A0A0L0HAN2_SPIPD|nr:uncharacterized protein SPPG_06768 [Spizellomyces punctatus DAOM BR117]KNC97768.1 hypothetical protein SPPG_06768 [Spizellomyces punctatus DAOM BR117]|eukprot:XP_016605808.1 hypothetical protein SPPG_06768 [Spizellomyces punctatus DAOM BR117]